MFRQEVYSSQVGKTRTDEAQGNQMVSGWKLRPVQSGRGCTESAETVAEL